MSCEESVTWMLGNMIGFVSWTLSQVSHFDYLNDTTNPGSCPVTFVYRYTTHLSNIMSPKRPPSPQFEYKHQIVSGKLLRCNANKLWVVQPTDR